MSLPSSIVSGEAFDSLSSSSPLSLTFESVEQTEVRLSYPISPTPVTRKGLVPQDCIRIHGDFSFLFGTVATFQSESRGGIMVDLTQQLPKGSLGLLVSDKTNSKS